MQIKENNIKNLVKIAKAQVSIFVIIGIFIVFAIGIIFFINLKYPILTKNIENPKEYIETCVYESLSEKVKALEEHAGYLEVPDLYVEYESEKIPYLCYTKDNFKICTNINPLQIEKAETQLEEAVQEDVEKCFLSLKKSFGRQGYEEEALSFEVDISPEIIEGNIDKRISYTKEDSKIVYDNFNVKINSELYDFLRITNKIINEEVNCDCGSESCNADTLALEKENEYKFIIRKFLTGRDEEIFEITELESGKEFKFAIRNCVKF